MTPTNTPAPASEAADVEPVAWASGDWLRSITETELALIPNEGKDKGRRDRCRSLYRIPLYVSPSTEVERLTKEVDHWIAENRRILKAGQDAAYKLADLESTIRSLEERLAEAERRAMVTDIAKAWPYGTHFSIEHDGFAGRVIGWYVRLDGKAGVVGQIDGARIVHVYGDKWLSKRKEGRSNG